MSASYRKTGDQWTVGWWYGSFAFWEAESDHATKEEAARRCNWLNGGRGLPYPSLVDPALRKK